MKWVKAALCAVLAIVMLTSCAEKLPSLKSVEGSYGDVTFSICDKAEKYNYTSDVFTEEKESGIYAKSELIAKCKIVSVDEMRVDVNMPMEQIIPAEESDTGEEEKITVYYPVTAYIELLTVKPEKIYHDSKESAEKGKKFRVMTRVSSRMWDKSAIPLFEGDECILFLQSSEAEDDIMKIKSRKIADYILYDSRNGVIKKTKDGYIFDKSQEFLSKGSKEFTAGSFDELSAEEKKCFENAEGYAEFAKGLFIAKEVDAAIEDNVRYYYDK